jgi:hypothetical protein
MILSNRKGIGTKADSLGHEKGGDQCRVGLATQMGGMAARRSQGSGNTAAERKGPGNGTSWLSGGMAVGNLKLSG